MKTIRVEVTTADIAKGKRKDCAACPLALAIRRATASPVHVGLSSCNVFDRYGRFPEAAKRFVADYDAGKRVEPFAFNLTLEGAAT